MTGWWLNQPIWKICSSNWIISPGIGVKIENVWNHHPDEIKHSTQIFWVKWSGSSSQYASKMCETISRGFLNLGYCHGTTVCEIFLASQHCMLEEVVEKCLFKNGSQMGSCSHLRSKVRLDTPLECECVEQVDSHSNGFDQITIRTHIPESPNKSVMSMISTSLKLNYGTWQPLQDPCQIACRIAKVNKHVLHSLGQVYFGVFQNGTRRVECSWMSSIFINDGSRGINHT